MADAKKILILYASAGHGHEKAARAVESLCRASGHQVDCVDTLERTSFGYGERYRKLYLFMIRTVPAVWGFFYYLTDNPLIYMLVRPLRRWTNHAFASGVERLIVDSSPDCVVSTHFLGTEVTAHLKKKRRTSAKLVTVVTDYKAHAIWLASENDRYCAASEETLDDLVRRGVPREKVHVTGIPIEAKFSQKLSRDEVRRSLGLDKSPFTVLLTSGGGGAGMLEGILDRLVLLEPALQILAVCGTNEPMRARLAAKHRRPNVKIFGFVNNVHELMAASDIMVGKGGGLTITECLAMSKPMILIGALPGQETRNVGVVTAKGAASRARSVTEAAALVQRYQKDAAFYGQARSAIEAMRRPNAAEAILKAALE